MIKTLWEIRSKNNDCGLPDKHFVFKQETGKKAPYLYFPEEYKVIYRSKDGKEERVFEALEWLAAMARHVPNKGEPHRAGLDTMAIIVTF